LALVELLRLTMGEEQIKDNFLPGKTIRGMKVFRYKGCGGCPIKDCSNTLSVSVVMLCHTGNECWDNWGKTVSVFSPGEIVGIRIMHDKCTVYCGAAGSTLYPGVYDYVSLENFNDHTCLEQKEVSNKPEI
jgi:hypothetical protein